MNMRMSLRIVSRISWIFFQTKYSQNLMNFMLYQMTAIDPSVSNLMQIFRRTQLTSLELSKQCGKLFVGSQNRLLKNIHCANISFMKMYSWIISFRLYNKVEHLVNLIRRYIAFQNLLRSLIQSGEVKHSN